MKSQEIFWENTYASEAQLNRYPFDAVVTFVYKNYPREKKRNEINILELGCGAGNNLWFAAREGFNVTGIDISESAIKYARKRFAEEKLEGEFIVGDFACISNLKKKYDLVVDRGALTCTTLEHAKNVITDVGEIMLTDAKIFINPLSDMHSSAASGVYADNGMVINMTHGESGTTELFFYGKRDIHYLFKKGFEIESLQHAEFEEVFTKDYFNHAEWRVIARKVGEKN